MVSVVSRIGYDPEKNLYFVSKIDGKFRTSGPLNVGFQVTRRCNLRCIYCSETPGLPDLRFSEIERGLKNLRGAGVLKVNITGGEALLRPDLRDIIDKSKELGFYVAIDSNATLVNEDLADFLTGKLVYFEATIDGTPKMHEKVRGRYDDVIRGIKTIANKGIPLYIAMVLIGKSEQDMQHVLMVADRFGAKCVKYITPIPKARGLELAGAYVFNPYLREMWDNICKFKEEKGLKPAISMADWARIGNGSVILVNSDGMMVGSPSVGESNCITPLGNILEDSVEDLWVRYPHKLNHIRKYTGETMLSCR